MKSFFLALSALYTANAAYSSCHILDCDSRVTLQTGFAANTAEIKFSAISEGWIALGFGPISTMTGADIHLAFVPGKGASSSLYTGPLPSISLYDYYASGLYLPSLDAQQDLNLVSGGYNSSINSTYVEYTRAVTATNSYDYTLTPGTKQYVLWAINKYQNSVTAIDGSAYTKHGAITRGYAFIDLASVPAWGNNCDEGYDQVCVRSSGGHGNHTTSDDYNDLLQQCAYGKMQSTGNVTLTQAQLSTFIEPGGPVSPCAVTPDNVIGVSFWPSSTDPETKIRFTVSTKSKSEYVAIGFSTSGGMDDADIIYAAVKPLDTSATTCKDATCIVTVVDAYSFGYSTPSVDPSQNITVISSSYNSDGYQVVFERNIATDSSRDHALSTPCRILFARGAYFGGGILPLSISKHTSASSTSSVVTVATAADTCYDYQFDQAADYILTGDALGSTPLYNSTSSGFNAATIHAICMVFAWWFLLTLGAIAGRYKAAYLGNISSNSNNSNSNNNFMDTDKVAGSNPTLNDPCAIAVPGNTTSSTGNNAITKKQSFFNKDTWFLAHVFTVITGIIISIAGFGVIVNSRRFVVSEWDQHEKVGFTCIVLSVAQALLGFIRPDLHSPKRNVWQWCHRLVGAVAFLAAYVAIPTGLKTYGLWNRKIYALIGLHACCCAIFIIIGEWNRNKVYGTNSTAVVAPASDKVCEAKSKCTQWCRYFALSIPFGCLAFALMGLLGQHDGLISFDFLTSHDEGNHHSPGRLLYNPFVTAKDRELHASRRRLLVNPNRVVCPKFPGDTVASVRTSYVCRVYDMPSQVDYHGIEFYPIIDNAELIHHMILFRPTDDYAVTAEDGVFDCVNMPDNRGPIYVWAPGSTAFILPSDVGLKLPSKVILQMHYDNPNLLSGRTDSSGVLVKMTSNLRPQTAGLLMMGPDISKIKIPAGGDVGIVNTCGGVLTSLMSAVLGIRELRVFGSAVHMHLLGKKIWSEQYRNNQRLQINGKDTLGSDLNYDFGYQRIAPVDYNAVSIKPGDTIKTRCIFRNTVAEGIRVGNPTAANGLEVTGGESSDQEMCLNFLYVAPSNPSYPFIPCNMDEPLVYFCGVPGMPNCTNF